MNIEHKIIKMMREFADYFELKELTEIHSKIFNDEMIFALDAVAQHEIFLDTIGSDVAKPYSELNEDNKYDCMLTFTAHDGLDYSYEAEDNQKILIEQIEKAIQKEINNASNR